MTLTTDELLEQATERAGLDDFGPDDWQEGFGRLVDSVNRDVGDDPDVVERIRTIIDDRLLNRLRFEDWWANHEAEAAAHPVEGPLVVIGTGRSGTTATHYLLAVDPQFRYLRKWEIVDPVPPPLLSAEQHDPRRPKEVEATVHHIATVDGPTEDRRILELCFHDDGRPLGLTTYCREWMDWDHAPAFPFHERVLRMLHSHRPPHRWLLKAPDFINNLPPLIAQYPDIRLVMTHRDPVKVIPSICSVTAEHVRRRLPNHRFDGPTFGREMLHHIAEGIRRFMRARDEFGDELFVDVGQPELSVDPVGVARRVYDHAGLELTDEVAAAMADWSEQNRAGSRGEHRYTLEEYGLTEAMIRAEFAEYLDRYGRWCEPIRGVPR